MRKVSACIILTFAALCGVQAKEPASAFKRITFGAEWSYIASFYSSTHHNFFSEDGYRVDINQRESGYESNGEALVHCGYSFNDRWNLSMYAGLTGIYDIGNSIPVSLRLTRYFNEKGTGDRWLCFIDGGSGICLKKHPQAIASGKIGGGYRISLSRTTKMDLTAAFRTSLTHPEIVYDGYAIPMEKTNRNNAFISAFSIGISLSF